MGHEVHTVPHGQRGAGARGSDTIVAVLLLPLLLACSDADGEGVRRIAQAGTGGVVRDDTADGTGDSTAPEDTAPPVDTGTPPDTDTTPPEPSTDVCWLGPARDHSVCVPTVAYSSSFGSDYDYPSPYGGSAQYAEPGRYVDLEAIDANLAVAPNFVVSEYMASYKGRWGIFQGHHVEELQAIRDAIGGALTITSGYRSPGYNAGVGGVEYSRHQYGDGSDLDASGWSVEELGDICDSLGADYVGLYEDGHTHCDWRDAPLDPAFYPSNRSAAAAPPPAERAELRRVGNAWEAPAAGFDEGEPLRRWTARDADGTVLLSALGRSFEPPPGTVRLSVVVGGRIHLDGP
jgi:hypothetical protein